ncbi:MULTISPECIES: hypothetical protein [Gordonia]|uniref:hypothetical protein n=1 Tax=Gordonia TaxID=2053 RepID=UPI0002F2A70A|nr:MULTISPECIES: hypothetical protein [Gordonia]MCM3894276.1 hypothetical protein [Gordonia sputi]
MRDEVWAALGAVWGALLLAFGVVYPPLWIVYVLAILSLLQPARTRSFGIGMATALLALGVFAAVRLSLDA